MPLYLAESETPTFQDLIEARYANFLRVGHNASEFILEFGQAYSGSTAEVLHTRIVTNPTYARHFFTVLGESLQKYDSDRGERGQVE